MICPACKYEYTETYGDKKEKSVIGPKGDFFFLEKKRFVRDDYTQPFEVKHKAAAYACPGCGVVFIDMTPVKDSP